MHCIVCVKQVPDTSDVKIDPQRNTLIREGVASILNPFDEFAVEEAIRTKEKCGGRVTVITMGPPQAEAILRNALAMGVDDVVLLSDRAFAGSDTLATSSVLSGAIKKLGDFDLIFCGKQAIDGDTAQVGPGIARRLGISQLTYVCNVDAIDPAGKSITVQRLLEGGKEVVTAKLPAMITVVKDINQPRFPSVLKLRKAQHAEIPVWTLADIEASRNEVGLDGSATQVVRIFTPEVRKGGEIIKEEPEKAVDTLLSKLLANKIL